MTAEQFFGSWWKCIDEKALDTIVVSVKNLIDSGHVIEPDYKSIFKAFSLCKYEDLKVVILGQDPYPQHGVATGLAFANKANTEKISPSLQVIKNCFDSDNFDVTLEHWAKQGVLLLNTSLTVELNKPGSHTALWRPFVASFLRKLGEWQTGIVYVLLGEQAKTFKPYIGVYNDIILCPHPSYFARINIPMPNIFEQIDRLTIGKNNLKIKWV